MKGTCIMIKPNEGTMDRIIRVVFGIIVLSLGNFLFTGGMQTTAFVIGAVSTLTGVIGFCGIYALFGISTCPMKK
jgi:hypothetical protein